MAKITAVTYVRQGDNIVPLDSLTDQEMTRFRGAMGSIFADIVGDYMRTHPEEAEAYAKSHPDRVEMMEESQ